MIQNVRYTRIKNLSGLLWAFVFIFYIHNSPLFAHSYNKFYNLNFELSVNKSTYLEGEPIILKMTVKNIGNNIDSISHSSLKYFFNTLKIQNNKSSGFYTFKVHANYIPPISYHKLNPGESITIKLELQKYRGSTYKAAAEDITLYLTEGIYSVYYKSGDDLRNLRYLSNTVNFDVIKPEGINAEIFDKLLRIYEMKEWDLFAPEREDRFKKEWAKQKYDSVVKLMKDYPQNPYTEKIYQLYNNYYRVLNLKDSILENNLWLINNYPDSYYLGGDYTDIFYTSGILYKTLNAAYLYKNGETSVNEIINMIIKNNPNTRASRIAEEYRISKKYKQ